jgi:hypothetical protein
VVWLDELYDLSDRWPDVKKMRVTEIDASAAPPPKAAPKGIATPSSAGPVKPNPAVKPPPAGLLRLVVTTDDPTLVDRLVDGMNRDGFYAAPSKTTAGLASSGSKLQQFSVTAGVLHREPADYKRKLTVPPPSAAQLTPPPPAIPVTPPAKPAAPDIGGGFDDFGFGGSP